MSERQHAEGEGRLKNDPVEASSIMAAISDAVITVDSRGLVNYLNPMAAKLTGWEPEDALGSTLEKVFKVIGEGVPLQMVDPVHRCLKDGAQVSRSAHNLVLLHREGVGIAIEESFSPIRDERYEVRGAVLVFRDVSRSRKLVAQVNWQVTHDPLTNLFNRVTFDHKLDDLLYSAKRDNRRHSLMYMDLDQFKIVNDTCGHVAGDELLRQVASLLARHVRDEDTLARLGGDEFGVLLAECPQQPALRIADEIRQAVQDYRFVWGDKSYAIGISIGVVTLTTDSESVEQVLSAADAACYAAKEGGRNQVHLFQVDEGEAALRQGEMRWVSRIHSALDEGRFVLYAQPIVPVANGRIKGHLEVLIRMLDKSGELVPPGAFIPAAERFNLMQKIDRWVVQAVFTMVASHRSHLIDVGLQFSINLSGSSISDPETLDFIDRKLREFELPEGMIVFEITETAAIANLSSAHHFISTLKQSGCRFSLDDFGSGLSSFAYLKNLPVDFLKIDGAFVKDLADDPIDHAMVEAINQIGHVMQLQTIAEFVENDAVLGRLRDIGVDFAQGFGVARPFPLIDENGQMMLNC